MERVYDSDLTDAQWLLIQHYFPEQDTTKAGRPREYDIRSILNAIFYISKTGCQWRMLPKDFPKWGLVWQYFRQWRDNALLEKIRQELNQKVRQKHGKESTPSVMIADSQSVKTAQKGGIKALMEANSSRDVSAIYW